MDCPLLPAELGSLTCDNMRKRLLQVVLSGVLSTGALSIKGQTKR
jgi:hypothetical protein